MHFLYKYLINNFHQCAYSGISRNKTSKTTNQSLNYIIFCFYKIYFLYDMIRQNGCDGLQQIKPFCLYTCLFQFFVVSLHHFLRYTTLWTTIE